MRSKLLAAAAAIAIVATGVVASANAQDNPQHEQRPGAEPMKPQAAPKAAPNAGQMERRETPNAAQMERREPAVKSEATAPPRGAEGERREPARRDAQEMKRPERGAQQEENRAEPPRRNEAMKPAAAEPQRETRPAERTGQNDNRGIAPGAERGQPRVLGKAHLSDEHAARVRDALSRSAHREHVDFAIDVGARVPESVIVRPLPAEVIALAPDYRGDDYFIDDNDEIVFVSPETHEIVGTIQYEGRATAVDEPTRVVGARPCPVEN